MVLNMGALEFADMLDYRTVARHWNAPRRQWQGDVAAVTAAKPGLTAVVVFPR
jgi:hypothetical protein